jgi:hypothetical protein
MRTTTAISLLLSLATSSAIAAGGPAFLCLSTIDPKECLAGVAVKALSSEKSAESRIDGYASLLSSLARAGVQHDGALVAANDDTEAPIYSRWTLAVSRRAYELRFGKDTHGIAESDRIEALAGLLRKRRDGLERLMLILSACEAREDAPKSALAKWNGALDRMCQMDDADAEALDRGFSGLAIMAAPLVDASNRDVESLHRSIEASAAVLSRYEATLNQKMSVKAREGVQGLLAIGHLLNSLALSTTGHQELAVRAIELSLSHLSKAKSLAPASEFQSLATLSSWVYAKAGLRSEAMKRVRDSLIKADGLPKGSGGDKVAVIAVAIETLRLLERER